MATVRNVVVKITADVSKLQKNLSKASKQFKDVGSKMTGVGKTLSTTVSAPLAGLAGLAVKTAADFEKSMSNVRAVTGASGKDFEKLKSKALEMGKSTSKSATDAADAIGYMGLAGWDTTQIMGSIEPVLRLSEAGNLDLARTSDLVTDSMSALGVETKDTGKFLDQVAQTSRKSNTAIDQMMEAIIGVGGNLKGLNVPLEEGNALLGVLANRGIKGSEAGNKLSAVLINLQAKSGQAADGMKGVGVQAYDATGKFRGVSVILKELRSKMAGMTEEQRNMYKNMIGGKTQVDTLNALLDGTGKELGSLQGSILDSNGALTEMAKVMQDNLHGQINVLKSTLEGLAIQFGNILLPYVKQFGSVLQKLSSFFTQLSPTIQKAVVIFGLFGIVIPPIVVVLGVLISSIGTVIGVIGAISAPVLAVGVVLAGLVGAFVGLAASSVSFREKLKSVFQSFIAKAVEMKTALIPILQMIKEKVKGFIDSLKKWWGENGVTVINTFKEAFSRAVGFITPIVEMLKRTFQKFAQDLKPTFDSLKTLWDNLVSLFKDNKAIILTVLGVLATVFAAKFALIAAVVVGFIKAFNGIVRTFSSLVDVIVNVVRLLLAIVKGDWDKIIEVSKDLGKSIMDTFENFGTTIADFVTGFVDTIVSLFKGLYNILVGNSIIPDLIKDIIKWFKNMPMKILVFLGSMVGRVVAKFVTMKTQVISKISTFVSSVVKKMKELGTKVISALGSVAKKAYEAGTKIVNQIKDGIMSKVNSVKDAISGIGDTIMSFLPQSPAKEGALKNLGDAGSKIVTQLSDAMKKEIPTLTLATSKLTSAIYDTFENDVSKVAEMFDKLRGNIQKAYGEMETDAKSGLNNLSDTVQSALKKKAKKQFEHNEENIKEALDADKEELTNKEKELSDYNKLMEVAYNNQLGQATLFHMNKKKEEFKDQIARIKSNIKFGETLLESNQKTYDDQISDQKLYNQTAALLQEENQKDLISLLKTFEPEWQDKGRSFADKFMEGFRSLNVDMATELNKVMSNVDNVLGTNVGGVLNETFKLEKQFSSTVQEMKNNAIAWDNASDKQKKALESRNELLGGKLGLSKKDGAWYLPDGGKAFDKSSNQSIEVPIYLDGQKIARGVMPHVVRDARFKGGLE